SKGGAGANSTSDGRRPASRASSSSSSSTFACPSGVSPAIARARYSLWWSAGTPGILPRPRDHGDAGRKWLTWRGRRVVGGREAHVTQRLALVCAHHPWRTV